MNLVTIHQWGATPNAASPCRLAATGSSVAVLTGAAVTLVVIGGALVMAGRRARPGRVGCTSIAVLAIVLLGPLSDARAAGASEACGPSANTSASARRGSDAAVEAEWLARLAEEAARTTTTAPPSPTTSVRGDPTGPTAHPSVTTTTTQAVPSANLSGTYRRDGRRVIETDPPGSYATDPISYGGSGWDLPTSVVDSGPVAGATVTLRFAGADGLFGSSDDVVWSATTDAAGGYTFSVSASGHYRVTVVDLPTPDRTYSGAYSFSSCIVSDTVSGWALTEPAGGQHNDVVVGVPADVGGLDFLSENTESGAAACA